MDDNPTRMIETDQSSCPIDAPEKSCRADSGAYIVHPARAAPSGTNRLDSITSPAAKNDQNDHMLMRGNAMSCVPILSGIRKFAYTPTSSGMMAKNTMNVPCIVTRWMEYSGRMTTPGAMLAGTVSPRVPACDGHVRRQVRASGATE